MDRVETYREIIREFLTSFAQNSEKDQLVFDNEHGRYLVIHNEWCNNRQMYGTSIHLDLIDSKIWIQQNNTEIYIDRELIQRGVDPKDLVLGLRAPAIRERIAAALYS
ncbi:MAG: element excision factor XisI family protein [Cyanobacteria bacterium J06621_11]